MKYICLLLTALSMNLAHAGDLAAGPPVTAEQLAMQLNIRNWSLVYSSTTPLTKVSVRLTYRHRDSPDEPFSSSPLVDFEYTSSFEPPKTLPLVVFVDAHHSSVILPNGSTGGPGATFEGRSQIIPVPEKDAGGHYTLLNLFFDEKKPITESNIKGRLELQIIPGK